jgi:aldehyde dehydrogenase (NAD+)
MPWAAERKLIFTACIYTSDIAKALQVSSAMESGVVSVNSAHIPQPNTPFGGTKQSGIGRELGTHGLYSYLESKTIHIQ